MDKNIMVHLYKRILLSNRKNELLIHTTYINLKKMMLSEEIRENGAYMISYIYISRK